ncbi:hypothetical protein [Pedobacter borealis]|uniref:hypothetical protein n=1 Tax=Pedobacter borealis TaxID=475254 RepID=UPI000493162B|nr:hypothetical protein [Pedobacter borealis]
MKRKKLSIDKLEIGFLSKDQEMSIRGGGADDSVVIVNTSCVGKTEPPEATSLTGCPNPFTTPSAEETTLVGCPGPTTTPPITSTC